MADNSLYTDSVGLFNGDHDNGECELAQSLRRALDYGLPSRLYADVFQVEADLPAMEQSLLLETIIAAAIWGAANAKDVLTARQTEETHIQAEEQEDREAWGDDE